MCYRLIWLLFVYCPNQAFTSKDGNVISHTARMSRLFFLTVLMLGACNVLQLFSPCVFSACRDGRPFSIVSASDRQTVGKERRDEEEQVCTHIVSPHGMSQCSWKFFCCRYFWLETWEWNVVQYGSAIANREAAYVQNFSKFCYFLSNVFTLIHQGFILSVSSSTGALQPHWALLNRCWNLWFVSVEFTVCAVYIGCCQAWSCFKRSDPFHDDSSKC